jgi:hypothetical protein
VRIGAEIESVAASTKAAKVVNSEREEDNILVDKVLEHLLSRRGSIVVKLLLFSHEVSLCCGNCRLRNT